MDKKKRKKIQKGVRLGIQLVFLLTAPALFTSAFSGIKYIFQQFASGELLAWNSFLSALITLGLFTIVFGRFFCGYACAFGTLGDVVYMISDLIQKKLKKKLPRIPEGADKLLKKVKYLILAGVAVTILFGIYEKFRGSSPWDVFSMMTSLRLPQKDYLIGVIILVLIVLGMAFEERFFCKYLCPMGAVFSLLPIFPKSLYQRERQNCIPGCSACKRMCPLRLEIDGDTGESGECIQCNQCVEICPKENISMGLFAENGKIKGNELWFVIGKAVVLLGICFLVGLTR